MNYWVFVLGVLMLSFQTDKTAASFSIDFGREGRVNDWYVVTDRVMGGISNSKVTYSEHSLLFSGYVSLENNGGFASVRSEQQSLDLSRFSKVQIRFRTANLDRTFALRLNTNNRYYKPSYNHNFKATSTDLQTLHFKLDEFKETILGKTTGNALPLVKLKRILRLGIMLNDKKEGNFSLEIDSIHFL